jgi:hypothetical protein
MPQDQCQCQSGGMSRVNARMRSLTRMIRCATTATTRQTIPSQRDTKKPGHGGR